MRGDASPMIPPSPFWEEPDWVTPAIIWEAFRLGQFWEQLERGELRSEVFRYDTHLNLRQRERLGEPLCTRSQMVLYATLEGHLVALVHQYRRIDGTLGASGLPDPKRLYYQGRVLAVKQIHS